MNHEFIIRSINEADAPILKNLANQCPPLDVHTAYTYWVVAKYFGEYSFMILEDELPIGYIMCVKNDECFLIWQIGILEKYRKKNISTLLIEKVFQKIKGSCVTPAVINVSIAPENKSSYCAFEKFCANNGYVMKEKEDLCLKDLDDPNFLEEEILYEITKEIRLYNE